MDQANSRRSFRHEGEERRREALIAATLDLVSEGGPQAATVRAIAERAGVTPGLIRHYFLTKDDLVGAAYQALMDRLTGDSVAVLAACPDDPRARLAAFVVASLRPPVVDARALGLWAGFLHQVRERPDMLAIHEAAYLAFRDQLQALIGAVLPGADSARLRGLAIACNAVMDGLWLEASALPSAFGRDEAARIGLASVAAILDVTLDFPQETA
jgi:AcrR family transcriptional regulator